MPEHVDVVIIGSGFGGSIPALRLTERGKKVVVLERGRRNTGRDFRQSWDPRYLINLYTVYSAENYSIFFRIAKSLGGGSIMFSGAMLRSPSEVFEYRDASGYRVWPAGITRSVMDPYYTIVERMMQVNQPLWENVPGAGGAFAKLFANIGKTCDRGRFPWVGCRECGFCEAGCIYDAKKNLMFNYIPMAEALGAEFRTECEAIDLKPTGGGYTVRYRDRNGDEQFIEGTICILGAGAIESAAILLRSQMKGDLPSLSDQTGKNFNNNGDTAFYFLLPKDFADFRAYKGRNNAAVISYAFWKEHKITIHTGCQPPAVFAGLEIHKKGRLPWGLEHKHFVKENYLNRLIGCLAIGLIDPPGEISVGSDGLPLISLPTTPALQAYMDRVEGIAQEIAGGNNAEVLQTLNNGYEHGDAHHLGTCRMGDDPVKSVTDVNGEVQNYPNLFVADSGSIPGGTGVNPSLTIAANAERIGRWIAQNR